MTTSEEARVFKLLDEYARKNHQCFVAEMFLNEEKNKYVVCFRPLAAGRDSANRFSCRYLNVEAPQAKMASEAGVLSSLAIAELDRKLAEINTDAQPD